MITSLIRRAMYTLAWDTRCRNVDVARLLRPFVGRETPVLDAGCGEYGLAAFIDSDKVVGVDILPTDVRIEGFSFVHGSILDLPFEDGQFPVAASVDVLEHLPAGLRGRAVAELVRCASRLVILTFPSGERAREVDEAYAAELKRTGTAVPDWLDEHLRSPYPEHADVSQLIRDEAAAAGRRVKISVAYSEPVPVAKKLRDLSIRSKYLYMLGNLAAGLLLPIVPAATAENAYRAIIVAEFVDE